MIFKKKKNYEIIWSLFSLNLFVETLFMFANANPRISWGVIKMVCLCIKAQNPNVDITLAFHFLFKLPQNNKKREKHS